jgi:hypothetical protein
MQKLLNQAAQAISGKGFRYLGDKNDFFHGHLIFEKRREGGESVFYPRAILYHTQEEAYGAHWGQKGISPDYDYVDVTARNWIQWLSDSPNEDGSRIENARYYLDVTKKDARQFYSSLPPQKEWHYTIHSHQLDNNLLGFVAHSALQFEFYLSNCEEFLESSYRGPIVISSQNEADRCLKIFGGAAYVEHDLFEKKNESFGLPFLAGNFSK